MPVFHSLNGFPKENRELEQTLNERYEALPRLAHTGHEGEIDNVLTALETGSRPLIDGNDGHLAVEIISAIYEAGFSESSRAAAHTRRSVLHRAGNSEPRAPLL